MTPTGRRTVLHGQEESHSRLEQGAEPRTLSCSTTLARLVRRTSGAEAGARAWKVASVNKRKAFPGASLPAGQLAAFKWLLFTACMLPVLPTGRRRMLQGAVCRSGSSRTLMTHNAQKQAVPAPGLCVHALSTQRGL